MNQSLANASIIAGIVLTAFGSSAVTKKAQAKSSWCLWRNEALPTCCRSFDILLRPARRSSAIAGALMLVWRMRTISISPSITASIFAIRRPARTRTRSRVAGMLLNKSSLGSIARQKPPQDSLLDISSTRNVEQQVCERALTD